MAAALKITELSPGDGFKWPGFMNATDEDVYIGGYTFDANGGSLVTVMYFASGRTYRCPVPGSGATVITVNPTGKSYADWFTPT